ncbi:MAG TPA: outer membrane beta-barrel protein [Cyclobacteriaceae bacterium]|jgi:hypothetical protein|nr:outer membrane beta-barrel protein [Cyclobacteriaceae bacterium]
MKKKILFSVLLSILSIKSYSQIIFENGYFINESDQKIDCLIKNIDWEDNPTEFEYKILQTGSTQKAHIQTTKEFGINGVSKFIRAKVKIDKSSDEVSDLSSEKNPIFHEEEIFLRVIIEGKASLYVYKKGNLNRYFYKANDPTINQLVYKRYRINTDGIAENNSFRQQLFNDLKCHGITLRDVKDIKYYRKDLKKLFLNFNECTNSSFLNYESKKKNELFNLSLRPGLNLGNLAIQNSSSNVYNTDFGNKVSFRFGIEAEFILPFRKHTWGILIEPTFQPYQLEKTIKSTSDPVFLGGLVAKVNYKPIEVPLGVRRHFFLNEESEIFINVSYIFVFDNNSKIEFKTGSGSLASFVDIKSESSAAFGAGLKYKNRFGIEIRYQTRREILENHAIWSSDYKTLAVIFGYTLF